MTLSESDMQEPLQKENPRQHGRIDSTFWLLGVLLILALAGVGINLYAYLRLADPRNVALHQAASFTTSVRETAKDLDRFSVADAVSGRESGREGEITLDQARHSPPVVPPAASVAPPQDPDLPMSAAEPISDQGREDGNIPLPAPAEPEAEQSFSIETVSAEAVKDALKPSAPSAADRPRPSSEAPTPDRPFPILPDLTPQLRRGEYQAAAELFQQALQEIREPFTISLEVACQPDTLQRALAHGAYHPALYMLPRNIGDRACFALLWGLYDTDDGARQAMEALPDYFIRQTPPPRVVPLESYLAPETPSVR